MPKAHEPGGSETAAQRADLPIPPAKVPKGPSALVTTMDQRIVTAHLRASRI